MHLERYPTQIMNDYQFKNNCMCGLARRGCEKPFCTMRELKSYKVNLWLNVTIIGI